MLDGINKIPKCRYGEDDCYFTVSLTVRQRARWGSWGFLPLRIPPPGRRLSSPGLGCQDHKNQHTKNVFKNMAVEAPPP